MWYLIVSIPDHCTLLTLLSYHTVYSRVGCLQSYLDAGMEISSKAGPNDPLLFTSKMVRTVALTKKTFSKKLVIKIIANCACYCTAPVNVHLF